MAKSKVFKGVIWASIQRFGTVAISFISNMVLARLLTPDDFGTIGMLLFFIAIAQTFVDSGFGAALIQKKQVSNEDINTVFYISMGMSIVSYMILFFSAPSIATFYNVPILSDLLRVLGMVVLISGVTIIQTVQLQKAMNFKTLSICNIVGTIVLAVSGIGAALLGFGVWSLVIRTLSGALVTSILLWIVGNWRPSFIFSKQSFKELFGFGGFMLLSSILLSISNNIQSMILGKMFKPATVGNFSQARSLRNIPSESISAVIGQVLYPDFSNHQESNEFLFEKLNKSAYLLSYVVSCLMGFCILVGPPLIHLVYGDQWDEAIPYFQIMCLGGIPLCLQDININVIKAKGNSMLLFVLNLIKVTLFVVAMVIGAKLYGIFGFLWVLVGYSIVAYLGFGIIAVNIIKKNIIPQLSVIGKSVLLSFSSYVVAFLCSSMYHPTSNLLWVLYDGFIYISLFLVSSYIFKCEAFLYLLNNIKSLNK